MDPDWVGVGALVTLSSSAEDRMRLEQIVSHAPSTGFLLRSASTLSHRGGTALEFLVPEVRTVWNPQIPTSGNDGALWAGRGTSISVTAGIRAGYGPLTLVLAPEFRHQENEEFQTLAYPRNVPVQRSPFASPFHQFPESADLPSRFGNGSRTEIGLGQSSVTLALGPVALGLSKENRWWGPGIRNAIVMSNNAEGVRHAFVRTAQPLQTRIGVVDGVWMLGRLLESGYFAPPAAPADSARGEAEAQGPSSRYLSGFAVTYAPAWEPNLTVGFSRVVYGTSRSRRLLPRAFAPFSATTAPTVDEPAQGPTGSGSDHLFSFFGRWVLPASGAEVYGEWARQVAPNSFRDFMDSPWHSQGYTVGLQWARETWGPGLLRLQTEFTNLEQSDTMRGRPVRSFYTSRRVPAGYTQRGQVIGAAVGPGSSTQWLAADYVAPRWRVGVFANRVRWNSDAFTRLARVFQTARQHDVTVAGGTRGGVQVGPVEVAAEFTLGRRYAYLFQGITRAFDDYDTVDVNANSLVLSISTALHR